jgi:hypothetical protein
LAPHGVCIAIERGLTETWHIKRPRALLQRKEKKKKKREEKEKEAKTK